jgi:D-alanyl-D-alanine dipeptidase
MRPRLLLPLLWSLPASASSAERGARADEEMVDLAVFAPRIVIELRYTGSRHLAKRPLYPPGARAYVRRSVAERLLAAQHWLDAQAPRGTRLKIWDAYRPPAAHLELWKVLPDAEYLGDPKRDGSLHSWGVAVDATLVDITGRELKMPTDFDVISPEARTYYIGGDKLVKRNLRWLQSAMSKAGFYVVRDEWWHFVARDWAAFAPVDMPLLPQRDTRPR